VDDVDMVAFVRLTAALRGDEGDRKKVVSNGDRDVVCHATAASVSKNRYGITEPLDFVAGENPFASIFGLKPKRAAKAAPKQAEEVAAVDDDGTDPADYANND
jgi:hypothetical protein